jgi:hypothetical protein
MANALISVAGVLSGPCIASFIRWRSPISLPNDIDLQQIPDDKTLPGMLESGEPDG